MGILGLIGSIFAPAASLIDNLHTSDEEKLILRNEFARIKSDVEIKTLELENKVIDSQSKIQLAELTQESFFVKAARPASIWMLLLIIGSNYLLSPFLAKFFQIRLPVLDESVIYTLGAVSGTFSLTRGIEKMRRKK